FFLPQPLQLATAEVHATVELDGAESHHLLHVLRAKVGDRIGLFNGRGEEAIAELVNHRKRSAELRITDCWTTPNESGELVLATALPKGDRARWLVEKATELGVTRIIPLRTVRSVVEPGEGKIDKLTQAAIAACKQSGRSRLPQIESLMSLSDALREFSASQATHLLVVADPSAERSFGQLLESGSFGAAHLADRNRRDRDQCGMETSWLKFVRRTVRKNPAACLTRRRVSCLLVEVSQSLIQRNASSASIIQKRSATRRSMGTPQA
ncbi:MAG: hypothetical protein FD138_4576, partial [Planctomycetota bacterium]